MSRQRVDMPTYFNLYVPALDWIMHGTAIKADDPLLDDIFNKCRDKKNKYDPGRFDVNYNQTKIKFSNF